jgi:hypothetical protein
MKTGATDNSQLSIHATSKSSLWQFLRILSSFANSMSSHLARGYVHKHKESIKAKSSLLLLGEVNDKL